MVSYSIVVCLRRDHPYLALSNVDADGDWKHCIVDDKLYLTQENFHESDQQRQDWDRINMADAEEECMLMIRPPIYCTF